MAKFELNGDPIANLIRKLDSFNVYDDQVAKEMLFSGGDIMTKNIKHAAIQAGHVDTGVMVKNIGYRKTVKKDRQGVKSITVTVFKTDHKGVRNAAKAFILNYGREAINGTIIGSHFWNRGRQKSEQQVIDKCTEITNKYIKEKGLI